jgi:MOSC domain-containing protein YiiM
VQTVSVLLSVNIARAHTAEYSGGPTGIDKRPVSGTVTVAAPGPSPLGPDGPTATAGSGLAGDSVYYREHGGDYQAVYAYAREDLDAWAAELGQELPGGAFGENLTTSGLDVSGALIGERWRVGADVVLEVTSPRIPCRTFAGWIGAEHWVKRFTLAARPGAYLRVIIGGEIRAGDMIEVVSQPEHSVSTSLVFRVLTTERELAPQLVPALDAMNPLHAAAVRKRLPAGQWDSAASR